MFELGTGEYTEGLSSIAIHFILAELHDTDLLINKGTETMLLYVLEKKLLYYSSYYDMRT